jgi:hypothetical protein
MPITHPEPGSAAQPLAADAATTTTPRQLAAAFTEWDRRFREEPERFEAESVRLLVGTPESYGEACAPYLLSLLPTTRPEVPGRFKAVLNRIVLCLLTVIVSIIVSSALLACGAGGNAHAAELGVHLTTAHSKSGFEGINPGAYLRLDNCATFGALRNSYGRLSVYAGCTLQTPERRFALTLGAITGYPAARVSLLVVPSVRFDAGSGYAVRLALLPKPPRHGSAVGLHLTLERAL